MAKSYSIKKQINAINDIQIRQALLALFEAVLADEDAHRAALVALTAKLDTDFTAQNAAVASSQLDVDYASTVDPAANVLVD